MKEIILTIIVTDDGIFVTKTERTDGKLSGRGYLNRQYDKLSIDIQSFDSVEKEIEKIETT